LIEVEKREIVIGHKLKRRAGQTRPLGSGLSAEIQWPFYPIFPLPARYEN
jgi:hypothetical protein